MSDRPTIGVLSDATRLPCHVVGCQSGLPGRVVIALLRAPESHRGLTPQGLAILETSRTYAICAECLDHMMSLALAEAQDALREMMEKGQLP